MKIKVYKVFKELLKLLSRDLLNKIRSLNQFIKNFFIKILSIDGES